MRSSKVPFGLDRVLQRHAEPLAEREVVLAEGERGVHDPGAVVGGHEVGREHGVAALAEVGHVGERRLVGAAHDLAGGLRLDPSPSTFSTSVGGHDQLLPVHVSAHVVDVRPHRQRGVGEQRPGRGGPRQEGDARLVGQREAHVDARVHHVLVALRDLVRGQRGAVTRAVGHDLVALVEQPLVPDLLQRPPDRLDVGVVEGEVGVVGVDPEADPLGQPVPLVHVLEHRLAALGVELGDAVALDVLLLGEAELLLDLQLDRQPVTVPARLAVDLAAAHRLEAREHVLEHAREHVVGARAAVGGRRTLVEDERLRPLAAAHRLVEDVALAPARRGHPPRARGTTGRRLRDGAAEAPPEIRAYLSVMVRLDLRPARTTVARTRSRPRARRRRMWRRASRSRGRTERALLARNRFEPSLTVRRRTLVVKVTRPSTEGVALNAHTNTPRRLTLSERFERERSAKHDFVGLRRGCGRHRDGRLGRLRGRGRRLGDRAALGRHRPGGPLVEGLDAVAVGRAAGEARVAEVAGTGAGQREGRIGTR